MTPKPRGWAAALRPGTIVAFRFPLGEREGTEPPKARPCLVLAVTEDCGERLVTIAYGTSADTASNRGLDIDIFDPQDCRASGLHRPSRFVLARRVTVAATDAGFTICNGSPVIGTVPPSVMSDLHRYLQALGAAITVDCRRGMLPTTRPPRQERKAGQAARRAPVIVRVMRRRPLKPRPAQRQAAEGRCAVFSQHPHSPSQADFRAHPIGPIFLSRHRERFPHCPINILGSRRPNHHYRQGGNHPPMRHPQTRLSERSLELPRVAHFAIKQQHYQKEPTMGLDIEFFRSRDDQDGLLYLRGHWDLFNLILAQDPPLAYPDYSDMVIDRRVLAKVESRLLAEMAANGIQPATGSPSIKELEDVYLDPEESFEEFLPHYLQVIQQLRRWADEYIELLCVWSA